MKQNANAKKKRRRLKKRFLVFACTHKKESISTFRLIHTRATPLTLRLPVHMAQCLPGAHFLSGRIYAVVGCMKQAAELRLRALEFMGRR